MNFVYVCAWIACIKYCRKNYYGGLKVKGELKSLIDFQKINIAG